MVSHRDLLNRFKARDAFAPLEMNERLSRNNGNASTGKRTKNKHFLSLMGFTLIELMLVVIIIGALAAMVLPRLTGRSEQARTSAAKADIKANIATALKLFELDTGGFPSTEEGLDALLTNSGSTTNWNGPYIEAKPIDPWGREYKYESPGTHRSQGYDLYSLGKDGKEGGNDDITNWQ
ncbi:type II secretion system major pseudopilin GspG [Candidatus Omnitrophota bacterium]